MENHHLFGIRALPHVRHCLSVGLGEGLPNDALHLGFGKSFCASERENRGHRRNHDAHGGRLGSHHDCLLDPILRQFEQGYIQRGVNKQKQMSVQKIK